MLMNGGGQFVYQQQDGDEAETDKECDNEPGTEERRLDANGDFCCTLDHDGDDNDDDGCDDELRQTLELQRDEDGVSLESLVEDGTHGDEQLSEENDSRVILRLTLSDGGVISTGMSSYPAESHASNANGSVVSTQTLSRQRYGTKVKC